MLKKREYPRLGERCFAGTLENGLRLTVVPKAGYKKAMAFLAVNYGSVDRVYERDGGTVTVPAGTAHFLEHKVFEMEDGGDAMALMARRGANVNAFTSPDMTAFHFDCTEGFEENLRLLLSFVASPRFTPGSVEREKPIITQEIRMNEDDPDDILYYGLLRSLYQHSRIREEVAGDPESVESVDADILAQCHRDFYVPANMSLVAVGNVDAGRVEDLLGELTPASSRPRPLTVSPGGERRGPAAVRAERELDVGAPLFLAGAKTKMGLFGRESVRFELTALLALSALMGTASPLYRRLYDEGLINETFGYDFENVAGVSHLSFGGETRDPDLVCLRVLEEAASLAARGVDPGFFARRKRTVYGGTIRALDSFDSICCNTAAGDFSGYDYFETLSILDGITAEDVRGFLAEYMEPSGFAISVVKRKED